ncbi:Uncharacterised protein [Mycobacteroides abscessus subsp. abscessus]|nr:Uncharacterised protein [Mycobacteroides abscessus subsp. abscessus]
MVRSDATMLCSERIIAWKAAERATNSPTSSCPCRIKVPMSDCWRRSMLVTFSVLVSNVPNCSRRCAMTADRARTFSMAWGTTPGNPSS